MQLLTVIDKLVTSLENGNPVDMIYLDMQKLSILCLIRGSLKRLNALELVATFINGSKTFKRTESNELY